MYDDIATLKSYGAPTYDSYGNAVRVAQERDVFVQPRSVYASEFYQAAQNGLKPSITLYLTNREDYQGEKVLTYQGKDYTVISSKGHVRDLPQKDLGIDISKHFTVNITSG